MRARISLVHSSGCVFQYPGVSGLRVGSKTAIAAERLAVTASYSQPLALVNVSRARLSTVPPVSSRLGRATYSTTCGPEDGATAPIVQLSVVVPSALRTTESGAGPPPLSSAVL